MDQATLGELLGLSRPSVNVALRSLEYARQAADGGVFDEPSFDTPSESPWLPEQVAAQWPYGLNADGTPSAAWHLFSGVQHP
ncbi:hypothetical protein ACFU9X_13065 [Streptomyces atratus]|uniref:hypothetical protein n=1 Tax=Streptomyces atratus TaxID=1893 RepID=UPI00368DBBCE